VKQCRIGRRGWPTVPMQPGCSAERLPTVHPCNTIKMTHALHQHIIAYILNSTIDGVHLCHERQKKRLALFEALCRWPLIGCMQQPAVGWERVRKRSAIDARCGCNLRKRIGAESEAFRLTEAVCTCFLSIQLHCRAHLRPPGCVEACSLALLLLCALRSLAAACLFPLRFAGVSSAARWLASLMSRRW